MVKGKSHTTGFTLIELLVVISIIGLLAALIFPVFTKVREKGRQTSCLSNMKQLGIAFKLYAQDYDERLPRSVAEGANDWPQTWDMQIQPELKNSQVLMCPSDTFSTREDVPGVGSQMFRSYAFTLNLENRSLAEVPASASSVLLVESTSLDQPHRPWNWILGATAYKLGKESLTVEFPVVSEYPEFRHNDRGNYLYLDAHVKSLVGPNPGFAGYNVDNDNIALCGPKDPLPQ